MQRLQMLTKWMAITSEISHFFCCGIPIVFSLLSLLASMGAIAFIPAEVNFLHEIMHDYEVPMIAVSALVLLLGWGLHFYAKKIDCRSTGCVHEPCAPKKKKSSKILFIATILFAVNLTGYFLLHT